MKADQEDRDTYIKEKIRNMEVYVKDLSQQISDKKEREKEEKVREIKEHEGANFEEEFSKNRQYKDCLECFQNYPAEYIGPVPHA